MAPGEEQELLPAELEAVASVVGGEAGVSGVEAAGAGGAGEAATAGEAAAGEAATEGAAPAGEATDGAGAAPAAEPLDDEPPEAEHFAPVGGERSVATPSFSTDVPGSGNWTSLESAVAQSVVGMLAMNMAGKEAVSRPERLGIAKSVSLT